MSATHQETWRDRAKRRWYTSRPGWKNGTEEFHEFIERHAPGARDVLELGPGPSNHTSVFLRRRYGRLDGLDIDPAIRTNASLHQAYVYEGGAWPTPDASYDLIVADFVLEHVDDPTNMAREAFRALRPGGAFVFRTPNMWHYVTLASRLTPHWFHERVAHKVRALEAGTHGPYPTFYRANTAGAARRHMSGAGLREEELRMIEKEPSYGFASPALFYPFLVYERAVNATGALAWARVNIFGAYRRPG